MSKSLNELMKQVEEFSSERGWDNNDPNQLITAILIELGELSEHFQWSSKFKDYDELKKKEIAYEFVDVLVYLLRLAGKSKVDLDEAFQDKLEKLAVKYPVGSNYKKQQELYRKTGRNKLYE
jgi:NTP pyrophosphatase (non-canonical NTP hydrolase)